MHALHGGARNAQSWLEMSAHVRSSRRRTNCKSGHGKNVAGSKEGAMLCQNIMQRPVKWILEHDTAATAARVMRDENIGFLPVCDRSGRVVGTLTDRDLAVRVVADDLPSGTLVAAVMSHDLVACAATDELAHAEELMSSRHKARIVCIDDGGHLAGVISIADVAKHDDGARAGRTMRDITERETR
jgi:CBS domain-containing protein